MQPPRFLDRPSIIKAKKELLEQAARDLVDAGADHYARSAATETLTEAARDFVKAERASWGKKRTA